MKEWAEIKEESCPLTVFLLWESLTQALAEIASLRENDGWKENFYDRCLLILEKMENVEQSGEGVALRKLQKIHSDESKKEAIKVLTSAFDRVKYQER